MKNGDFWTDVKKGVLISLGSVLIAGYMAKEVWMVKTIYEINTKIEVLEAIQTPTAKNIDLTKITTLKQ